MKIFILLKLMFRKMYARVLLLLLMALLVGIFGTHLLLAFTEEAALNNVVATKKMEDTVMLDLFEYATNEIGKNPYWNQFYDAINQQLAVNALGRQGRYIIEVEKDKQGLLLATSQSILNRINLPLSKGKVVAWEKGTTEIPLILDHRLSKNYAIGDLIQGTIFAVGVGENDEIGHNIACKVTGFLDRSNTHIFLSAGMGYNPTISTFVWRELYDYLPEDEVLHIPLFIVPYDPLIEMGFVAPYSEGNVYALHLKTTEPETVKALQQKLKQEGIGNAYTIKQIIAIEKAAKQEGDTRLILYFCTFLVVIIFGIAGVQFAFFQHQTSTISVLRMIGMSWLTWKKIWMIAFNFMLAVFTYIGGQLVPFAGSFESYYFYLTKGSISALLPMFIVVFVSMVESIILLRFWSKEEIMLLYRREKN